MTSLDWLVVAGYALLVLFLGRLASRTSNSESEYFLAGRDTGPAPVAASTWAAKLSVDLHWGAGRSNLREFCIHAAMVWIVPCRIRCCNTVDTRVLSVQGANDLFVSWYPFRALVAVERCARFHHKSMFGKCSAVGRMRSRCLSLL